jgi:hypothetical protein
MLCSLFSFLPRQAGRACGLSASSHLDFRQFRRFGPEQLKISRPVSHTLGCQASSHRHVEARDIGRPDTLSGSPNRSANSRRVGWLTNYPRVKASSDSPTVKDNEPIQDGFDVTAAQDLLSDSTQYVLSMFYPVLPDKVSKAVARVGLHVVLSLLVL